MKTYYVIYSEWVGHDGGRVLLKRVDIRLEPVKSVATNEVVEDGVCGQMGPWKVITLGSFATLFGAEMKVGELFGAVEEVSCSNDPYVIKSYILG